MTPDEGLTASWDDLFAEARAFEEWHAPSRVSYNAWVGIEPHTGDFYGGWSCEGEALYYEWDESVMTTASGDSPEHVMADLIRIARSYRARVDADRVEFEAEVPA